MKNMGNVFILGDSYSTFENFIPKGYSCWYDKVIKNDTDVSAVTETWWHKLLEATESSLVMNNSWSGSTICHTGYDGADNSKTSSFCVRIEKLIESGFFKENKIDTLFIFGGTNDSWANSPLGDINYGEKSREDLYSVFPAYCYLIEALKSNLPSTRIITVINTDLKPQIIDCFEKVSAHYNTEAFKLTDIEKQSGHPNKRGMEQIYSQILEKL